MGLDIYVMPLLRFKTDDFRSPVEIATGVRPKIVTSDGVFERPIRTGWREQWKARREIRKIRRAVEWVNRTRISWRDEGNVIYSEQSPGIEGLRAYARWLDCRKQFPEFGQPPEGNYYKHPVMAIQIAKPSFPHLINHSCYNGYFLPCEFETVVEVEPYMIFGTWPATRQVGSSFRLLHELEPLNRDLKSPNDYIWANDDPMAPVKYGYSQLRTVAELSCQHGLPIIFWG